MNRPPYTLARACTLADETYFHRAQLLRRLKALAFGRSVIVRPARLGRGPSPNGASASVSARQGGHYEHLGYVLRPGLEADELVAQLEADLCDAGPERKAA